MSSDFNPYQILNVTPDATPQEINASFKKLSRTFHPDRNSSDDLAASRDQFQAISRAKDILSNPQHRRAYDSFGAKGLSLMSRGDVYPEINSLQIGKAYRTDEAVEHLLHYYLKRE